MNQRKLRMNKYSYGVLTDCPYTRRVSTQGGSTRRGSNMTAVGRAAGVAAALPGCTVSGRPALKLSPPPF